jgi:hypothetical protein
MKEMKYTKERKLICLHEERIDNYLIIIMNYGHYPCAYIGLPKEHPYNNKSYDYTETGQELHINCHGGLTYANKGLQGFHSDTWFLGWDYGHCDDFHGYSIGEEGFEWEKNNKKWTSKEIYKECLKVLKQLKNVKI